MPNTLGQLTRAFVYAESAPLTAVAGAGQEPLIAAVRGELDDLSTRYPSLIRSLEADLLRQDLPWHTQRYLCEAILNHYLSASDWDAISRLLLHHPDPVVRVAAAGLLVGIGFDDAPVIDLIHVPRRVSSYLETEIRRPPRLRELTNLLLDLALHCEADTLSYDHGYGTSKYTPQAIRIPALYHLVVLAGHRANLLPAVPALVGLLSQNTWLNYRVTWLMTEIAEHKVRGPQAILEALQAHPAVERQQWADDKNVVKLEAVCRERLEKRARKSVVSTR